MCPCMVSFWAQLVALVAGGQRTKVFLYISILANLQIHWHDFLRLCGPKARTHAPYLHSVLNVIQWSQIEQSDMLLGRPDCDRDESLPLRIMLDS